MAYNYQIVYPFTYDIYGDSFKEAVKNYVKTNYDVRIRNMIIKDQLDHYETRLRYYKEENKNKVGIDVYPYTNINGPYMVYGENKLRMPMGSSIVQPVNAITTVMPPLINYGTGYSSGYSTGYGSGYVPTYGSGYVPPYGSGPIVTDSSDGTGVYATPTETLVPSIFTTLAKLL